MDVPSARSADSTTIQELHSHMHQAYREPPHPSQVSPESTQPQPTPFITVSGTNDTECAGDADRGFVRASLLTDVGETSPDDAVVADEDDEEKSNAQRLAPLLPSTSHRSSPSATRGVVTTRPPHSNDADRVSRARDCAVTVPRAMNC